MEQTKTKDELLKELQDIAKKMQSLKETISLMLDDFDDLEKKYWELVDEIKK